MNTQFTQPKGSVSKETNKESISRVFGVKKSEVAYMAAGLVLTGYRVIYDKIIQRSYVLPGGITAGSTATSLTNGVLVYSGGTVDLGALAVVREEFVALTDTFATGFTINIKNEIVSDGVHLYRWDGSLSTPKVVAAGSTPTSDGIGIGKWLTVDMAGLGTNLTGIVGETRNAKMTITTASATATFTADELIVTTALGGAQYRIGSFNKAINLAVVGVGGMDVGVAPVSGYVALYAIYNPTTAVSALLAVNATAAVVPEVYGGANMPAGYTASALVSVLGTNTSSQFKAGYQNGRHVSFPSLVVLNTSGSGSSNPFSAFSISTAVPRNAKDVNLTATIGSSNAGGSVYSSINIGADVSGAAAGTVTACGTTGATTSSSTVMNMQVVTPQTLYQTLFTSAGTTTYNVTISSYTF